MMLATIITASFVPLSLALPSIEPNVNDPAVSNLDNQNKVQWCKDPGFRNCKLQHFEVSGCNSVLFPGEVSGVIVSNIDFKSITTWEDDDCLGRSICLWHSVGDLKAKKFGNRPRSFQMYRVHYKRESHALSAVSDPGKPVLSRLHKRDTNLSPVSDLSCIQLCKDVHPRGSSDDNDWTGDNCHNYCDYKMQICTDVGDLDWPLSAINIRPVYGNGLASPNGHVILFDEPDCTGVSLELWYSVHDLRDVGFNDRAKSLLVMP